MKDVARILWNAPVQYAPAFAAALLAVSWTEHLAGMAVPWLWLLPTIYAVIRLPRHGGVLSGAARSEFEPTGPELIMAVLCVASFAMGLIAGWSQEAGGGTFLYPAIALGLLYLRMVLRHRKQAYPDQLLQE